MTVRFIYLFIYIQFQYRQALKFIYPFLYTITNFYDFSDVSRTIFIPLYRHAWPNSGAPKMKNTFIYTIILHHRLRFFLFNLSKTYFFHFKLSYRPSTFKYGATVCVTASPRPLGLQVTVYPKKPSQYITGFIILCFSSSNWFYPLSLWPHFW